MFHIYINVHLYALCIVDAAFVRFKLSIIKIFFAIVA